MLAAKPVGRGAAARKYDLITALGAMALAAPPGEQRLILRLITLLTGRYNWAEDRLAVGQREIARLWSVDERTVKREMARLRARGWLCVRRQGTRGRVTEYRLEIAHLLDATRPAWERIGPDFVVRLSGPEPAAESNIVPFAPRPGQEIQSEGLWGIAAARLAAEDRALYQTWFADLREQRCADAILVLRAPSRFHATYVMTHHHARLLRACCLADRELRDLRVES